MRIAVDRPASHGVSGAERCGVGQIPRDRFRIDPHHQFREDAFEVAARHQRRRRSTESSATTVPSYRTMTREQTRSTTSRMCELYRTALPRLASVRTRWRSTSVVVTSSPDSGSSNRMTDGIVQQRGGDQHLLPHPLRYDAIDLIGGAKDAEQIEEPVDLHRQQRFSGFRAGGRSARGIRVRRGRDTGTLLPGCSRAAPEGDRIQMDVAAVVFDAAGRRFQQPRQHPRGRRLARAVRPR